MFSWKSFLLCFIVFVGVCATYSSAQNEEDALRDIQIGMAGLKEAGKDPALLAQLFRDLQDPEMMAAAKEMMDNPQFQKHMKKLSESKDFKENIKKTADTLKDPNEAAKLEAKMEHMLKRGEDELKKGALNTMEDAMASMSDPNVMAEMSRMMHDPNFKAQLKAMTQDPKFKDYVDAMQEMMKDPQKKKKVEALSEAMRNTL